VPPKKYPTLLRGWVNVLLSTEYELPPLAEVEARRLVPQAVLEGKTSILSAGQICQVVLLALGQNAAKEAPQILWSATAEFPQLLPVGRFYFVAIEARVQEGLPVEFTELKGGTANRAWALWAGVDAAQATLMLRVRPFGQVRQARLKLTSSTNFKVDRTVLIEAWKQTG